MLIDTQTLQNNNECIKSITMKLDIDNKELSQLLIAVALKRDKHAFATLFKFFAPKIKGISASKFPNTDQANEVVQETMSKVWRKAHLYNADKGLATTWVYTVMRNVTFDMLRKVQSNKEDTLSDDIWPIAEQATSIDEPFEDHLAKSNILACLDSLSESQQQVVKGFYFLEMSQEQLAQHLNIPLGTIKSRLRLALAKLKQQLGDDND
jgi:RNA polymerase sigma-70 factor (ECF subfamily)